MGAKGKPVTDLLTEARRLVQRKAEQDRQRLAEVRRSGGRMFWATYAAGLAADGYPLPAIARRVGCSPFEARGLVSAFGRHQAGASLTKACEAVRLPSKGL
ncbi:MAG: hypothetical protein FJZ00_00440 [Candidatus Sericytochromatia bacterium]|uniref:Uncharacterized protein n=1 Tax=Candidatus Tanganyikabacteria bacterium TaxID=2961651 RepID=A0A938BLT7_9BACT|nr:hypothetical protein [Candidatus Tanganyikabacteria bacterium]